MNGTVLILRPEPGGGRTAARARALGLTAVRAPLFTVRPLPWTAPAPGAFDAVMLTSAHAARFGRDAMASWRRLPCYAVGRATAAAAREAGFADVRVGDGDGAALLDRMAAEGVRRCLHPAGRDRMDLSHPQVRIVAVPVYEAEARRRLPAEAETALRREALVLLHSPRAAALFAELAGNRRGDIRIAAISPAAAAAAGPGWKAVAAAAHPSDEALLELAAKLCQTGGQ